MRNLAIVIFVLTLLASPAIAKDDYIKYDLDTLAKKSQARLKEIDKKTEELKRKDEAAKKLAELDTVYQQAESLYNDGKFNEAKALYNKVGAYSKDPDVKAAAMEKQKELDRIEKVKKEGAREKARFEKEAARKAEAAARDAKRAEEKAKLAAEKAERKVKKNNSKEK